MEGSSVDPIPIHSTLQHFVRTELYKISRSSQASDSAPSQIGIEEQGGIVNINPFLVNTDSFGQSIRVSGKETEGNSDIVTFGQSDDSGSEAVDSSDDVICGESSYDSGTEADDNGDFVTSWQSSDVSGTEAENNIDLITSGQPNDVSETEAKDNGANVTSGQPSDVLETEAKDNGVNVNSGQPSDVSEIKAVNVTSGRLNGVCGRETEDNGHSAPYIVMSSQYRDKVNNFGQSRDVSESDLDDKLGHFTFGRLGVESDNDEREYNEPDAVNQWTDYRTRCDSLAESEDSKYSRILSVLLNGGELSDTSIESDCESSNDADIETDGNDWEVVWDKWEMVRDYAIGFPLIRRYPGYNEYYCPNQENDTAEVTNNGAAISVEDDQFTDGRSNHELSTTGATINGKLVSVDGHQISHLGDVACAGATVNGELISVDDCQYLLNLPDEWDLPQTDAYESLGYFSRSPDNSLNHPVLPSNQTSLVNTSSQQCSFLKQTPDAIVSTQSVSDEWRSEQNKCAHKYVNIPTVVQEKMDEADYLPKKRRSRQARTKNGIQKSKSAKRKTRLTGNDGLPVGHIPEQLVKNFYKASLDVNVSATPTQNQYSDSQTASLTVSATPTQNQYSDRQTAALTVSATPIQNQYSDSQTASYTAIKTNAMSDGCSLNMNIRNGSINNPNVIVCGSNGITNNPEWISKNPIGIMNNPCTIINNSNDIVDNSNLTINNPNWIISNPNATISNPNVITNNPYGMISNPNAIINNPNAITNNPYGMINNVIINKPNWTMNNPAENIFPNCKQTVVQDTLPTPLTYSCGTLTNNTTTAIRPCKTSTQSSQQLQTCPQMSMNPNVPQDYSINPQTSGTFVGHFSSLHAKGSHAQPHFKLQSAGTFGAPTVYASTVYTILQPIVPVQSIVKDKPQLRTIRPKP